MTHTYTILGRPVSTTNSQRIINLPTKKKEHRAPGEEVKYRPSIIKSKHGLAWDKSAKEQLKRQKAERRADCIDGPVDVSIKVYRAINAGDVDNFIKGLLDVLAATYILRNDRLVMKVDAEKFTDPRNPRYEVTITERPHQASMFPFEPEEEEPVMEDRDDDIPPEFMTAEERAAAGL